VAGVLLTLIVSSTPPSGTLAALPDLARPAQELVTLPAVPSDARALDTQAPDTQALDTEALAPEPSPAALAPAAPAAAPAPTPSAPRAVVRAAERPERLWAQLRDGLTITGVATWYPGTRGYAGIPHVAMPGARYLAHGRTAPRALVCAGHRCTVVRVVDACACFVGTRQARVVDLSATTLLRLGLDHQRGVYQVRVTLLAP
jgi:rare lipoprotein A (peptidoglycan hydrolase)